MSWKGAPALRIAVVVLSLAVTLSATGATASGRRGAVVTDSRYATNAALGVLRSGGSAADAAVAAAFVLAALEEQPCDLGGGGAVLHYERDTGLIRALDFLGSPSNPEFDPEGSSYDTRVLAPGFLRGVGLLHSRFGLLDWKSVVDPARLLATEQANPALASLFDSIGRDHAHFGWDPMESKFLQWAGEQHLPLTRRDLGGVDAKWEAPIRVDYGDYEAFSLLPPSGGGLVFAEAMSILAGFDLSPQPHSSRFTQLVARATLAAIRDNAAERTGNPDPGRRVQIAHILSREHLAETRKQADRRDLPPEPIPSFSGSPQSSVIVVTDPRGNIVTCVCTRARTTVPTPVRGVTLGTSSVANAAPWVLPMIVLQGGAPWLAGGPTDGALGLQTILTALFAMVRGASPVAAVSAPRFSLDLETAQLLYERSLVPLETVDEINRLGLGALPVDSIERLNLLTWKPDGEILAVSDPRAEGATGGY